MKLVPTLRCLSVIVLTFQGLILRQKCVFLLKTGVHLINRQQKTLQAVLSNINGF